MKRIIYILSVLLPAAMIAHADTEESPSGSLQFICLPYLHAFHLNTAHQPVMLFPANRFGELTEQRIHITVTSILSRQSSNGVIRIVDSQNASGPGIGADGSVAIPVPGAPAVSGPLHTASVASAPLWLQHSMISRQSWHAPALTPLALAAAVAERKRKARLAEKMADRAFYFGYDENNEALK